MDQSADRKLTVQSVRMSHSVTQIHLEVLRLTNQSQAQSLHSLPGHRPQIEVNYPTLVRPSQALEESAKLLNSSASTR